MGLRPKLPTAKGTAEMFTGDVWLDVLSDGEPPSRLRVWAVHFTPGARTAWHAHPKGQTLVVTDGVGLAQSRGEPVIELHAGDVVQAGPDEWHWHGAAPDRFMTHLAVWEAPSEGPEAQWGEHVTDAEYGSDGR